MNGRVQYLLDTNVISELRKKTANPQVMAFFRSAHSSALFVSVLTLGELRKGAAMKARLDPDGALNLAVWIDGLESSFSDRIVNVDVATARKWGEISADRSRPVIDTLLAATAIAHDMTLVTRNTKDLQGIELRLFNPWAGL